MEETPPPLHWLPLPSLNTVSAKAEASATESPNGEDPLPQVSRKCTDATQVPGVSPPATP